MKAIHQPLEQQISAFLAEAAKTAPPGALATVGAEIARMIESGAGSNLVTQGAPAPDFALPDAKGGTTQLAKLLERGPVVLAFYRGGWCPFCDLQLRAYQASLGAIEAHGATLVAISPQTPDYALSDKEKKALTFPVLSDVGNRVAREYGLVVKFSAGLQKVQAAFDAPLPRFNGDESWEAPTPAVFVVDRGGVIRFASANADYTKRVEPAAILRCLEALRAD
jgi:peroxiredoxin